MLLKHMVYFDQIMHNSAGNYQFPSDAEYYWSIALQMEHGFLAIILNLKWEF